VKPPCSRAQINPSPQHAAMMLPLDSKIEA
jgi:hypothetical protein